jgi:hypothetical protein
MSLDKKINEIKLGMAISTYSNKNTSLDRYLIIDKSLESLNEYLKNTSLKIYCVIIVDGPIPEKHWEILNKYNFNIYCRKINGGVACTKNTSIRKLIENKIDIGVLLDDDVFYYCGSFEKYVESMIKCKLHHMLYCQMDENIRPKNQWKNHDYYKVDINNHFVMRHRGKGVGCLLTFTPELINKIGYFKVMSGKYGYEHINFTFRAIKSGMISNSYDIVNSEQYIDHIGFEHLGKGKFKKIHSICEKERITENNKNKNEWKSDLTQYIEIIEN